MSQKLFVFLLLLKGMSLVYVNMNLQNKVINSMKPPTHILFAS